MWRVFATVALVGWLATPSSALAQIDVPLNAENTKVTFVGTKPTGKHDGGFKKLTGSARFEPNDASSLKISIELDMNSLFTDNDTLTSHLKSPDFFAVKAYPKSKFVSTRVQKSGDDYALTANFTLCGKTRPVSFPAKIETYTDGLVLSSAFSINRRDWGINYGKGKIDDQVSLAIALRARKYPARGTN
jgi:polyisoprenoid-binding protein YceI